MLPAGLLRAKVVQRTIAPSFVDPGKPSIQAAAAEVVRMFAQAAEQRQRLGELLSEVELMCRERRDHRMVRGLAHLARGRGQEADAATVVEPKLLRHEVFHLAAARGPVAHDDRQAAIAGHPTAQQVLAEVGARHGLSAEAVGESLYADLPSEQRLEGFTIDDPAWLIHRYNVALVQGLLLRATDVRLTLGGASTPRLKQLFRWVKFHQLLHRVEVDGATVSVHLDGPMSMFQGSTRYGRQLARFFPALCLQDPPWEMQATVLWTRARHRKELAISDRDGLVSHLADTGAYRTRAVEHFAERFAQEGGEWTLTDARAPVHVGSEVLFPDFLGRTGGRMAQLEILGHWRGDALDRRLRAVAEESDRPPLVFAVSRRLAGGRADPMPEHPHVVPFAEVLSPKRVIEAFERVARRAPNPDQA